MKVVEFTEEQLSDIGKIGDALFYDENDPKSPTYKRVLYRPPIKWIKIISFAIIPFVLLALLVFVLLKFGVSFTMSLIIATILLLIYIILILKRAIICIIKIYQRYAPASVRNKCRFEPSCSEYMILAIEKYGLIKGLNKGIHRLKRCNINNGGYDFP